MFLDCQSSSIRSYNIARLSWTALVKNPGTLCKRLSCVMLQCTAVKLLAVIKDRQTCCVTDFSDSTAVDIDHGATLALLNKVLLSQ